MQTFSLLDLVRVKQGGSPRQALQESAELAKHAEKLGYHRIWVAEHHNFPTIASSATAVVIAHLAQATRTIRVGAGGIMLPNHSPMVIAEQFGTLAQLYPGRIDLGLGRAPGTDPLTVRALRRPPEAAEHFPQDVVELQAYFQPEAATRPVQAVPAAGTAVPLWILGSSLFGASLAAELGLPYAFASHFAPMQIRSALETYRSRFKPSKVLDRPHVMVAANAIVADTKEEARHLATSLQMSFADLFRKTRGLLRPPIDDINTYWSSFERIKAGEMLACSSFGTAEIVHRWLADFLQVTAADELIVVSDVYDFEKRLHSVTALAEILKDLADNGGKP